MIACTDTHYSEVASRTALVLFEDWSDAEPAKEFVKERPIEPSEYVPGQFYRRELPCILDVAGPLLTVIDTFVIDGYVWLDDSGRMGLGAKLHEAIGKDINVIGVAKSRFSGSAGQEIFRGQSRHPLIVTAVGFDDDEAAQLIQSMHGRHRVPTLIKRADSLCRHHFDPRVPKQE